MIRRFFAFWKLLAIVALFFILATFLLDFFVELEGGQRAVLEALDIAAIAILAIDLLIQYAESKRKKSFVRENWLMIASLFPFAQFLRVLRLVKVLGAAIAGWFSKLFYYFSRSTKFMRAYRVFAVWFSKRNEKSRKKS